MIKVNWLSVFVICGLSYKTAPLTLRESMASYFSSSAVSKEIFINLPYIQEGLILSTCNRTEFYCYTESPEKLLPWILSTLQLEENALPYFYIKKDTEAFHHALNVACGLDAMMLGEPQVFGQLKQAYQTALATNTIGKYLQSTFQHIFQATKRVRGQSDLGKYPVSVAYAAIQLIKQRVPHFQSKNVLIIGSGDTASIVTKYLYQQGVTRFMVASRSSENARFLAKGVQGTALGITELPAFISKADIIISATSCPLPFINRSLLEPALKERNNVSMLLFDLAMPRDIDPDVMSLDAISLLTLEDLHSLVSEGQEQRKNAAECAAKLIDTEIMQYQQRQKGLRANHIIAEYRQQMKTFTDQEFIRMQQKLPQDTLFEPILREFSERLMNKVMHLPTLGLRQAAQDDRFELLDFVRYLLSDTLEKTPT